MTAPAFSWDQMPLAPEAPTPAPSSAGSGFDWNAMPKAAAPEGILSRVAGAGSDLVRGFVNDANKTAIGLRKVANRVLPYAAKVDPTSAILENALPNGQIPALPVEGDAKTGLAPMDLENRGVMQHVGGGAEQAAEWLIGDEAIGAVADVAKGMKYLKSGSAIADYFAKSPKAARAIMALGNIAKSAAIGGAQGGVKGAATGEGIEGAESGALSGAAYGALGEGIGAAAETLPGKIGRSLEQGATKPGNSILRAKAARSFLYGKNPGRVFLDEKIPITNNIESLDAHLGAAQDRVEAEIKTHLADPQIAGKKIDIVPTVENTVRAALQDVAQQSGLANRQGVIKAINTVRDDILGRFDPEGNLIGTLNTTRLTPTEVQGVKRSIGKSVRWRGVAGDPEIMDYVNGVRAAIYGKLNDMVEQVAPGTKTLNLRDANLIEAQRLLSDRIVKEGTNELGVNRLLRKGEWAAAIDSLLHGHYTEGAALIANRLYRSTAGRIIRSRAAEATGKAIQRAAPAIARTGRTISGAAAPLGTISAEGEGSALAGES